MSASASPTDYAAARQAMIDSQLRPQGVTDPLVIAAMASVERERFVPEAARAWAYADRPVPLGAGRAMPAPSTLGILLDAIRPVAGERALILGPNDGYAAAVLEAIGVQSLSAAAKAGNEDSKVEIVLIDGAVDHIPDALVARLADGGRLGASLIDGGVTRLILGRKAGTAFGYRVIADADVPALPGFTRPPAFVF